MADQSLLNQRQDELMSALSTAWARAQQDKLAVPDSLRDAAQKALAALQGGGSWPDVAWTEEILMIGANACAAGVLNHGMYPELKDNCIALYQEVLDRRWLQGGPTGRLEQHEVEGLGRAVGQWQLHKAPRDIIHESPTPKKKRWFKS